MYAATEDPHLVPSAASTSRLEAFSDGVIAVIITIMVLELKVPRQNGFPGLRAVLPVLLVYLLSFTFTAIYWINHHHLVGRIEEVDPRILYANLFFLFSLSLLPFFTSWVLEKGMDSFSVLIYAISLMVTGSGFLLLRLAVDRRVRERGELTDENTAEKRKHIASIALYLLAIPLAFRYPRIALADLAIVTLLWIQPTAPISRRSNPSRMHPGPLRHTHSTETPQRPS